MNCTTNYVTGWLILLLSSTPDNVYVFSFVFLFSVLPLRTRRKRRKPLFSAPPRISGREIWSYFPPRKPRRYKGSRLINHDFHQQVIYLIKKAESCVTAAVKAVNVTLSAFSWAFPSHWFPASSQSSALSSGLSGQYIFSSLIITITPFYVLTLDTHLILYPRKNCVACLGSR
mgnify:CR=1 FL=1